MRPASDNPEPTLIIPFAQTGAAGSGTALPALPHLGRLLERWHPGATDLQSDYTLTPPHERALGWALGWADPGDGRWPWAGWHAGRAGVPCAWLTPCHWSVGMEQVTVLPPDGLDLTEAESRALLDALAPWAQEDGLQLTLESPTRWRAEGEPLRDLSSASLDRVAHRRADAWLPDAQRGAAERLMLRLQNEAQMLFYQHPVHDARQARGQLPINGFWVSASGAWPGGAGPEAHPQTVVNHALRPPALAGDLQRWSQQWAELDRDVIAPWLDAAARQPETTWRLVLCGERGWACWQSRPAGGTPLQPKPWWRRWWPARAQRAVTPAQALSDL